ncbi:Alkaline phosphatase synthesis sensor protein PhoR [compost metagenome]
MSVELEREKMKITIADTGEGILPQDMPFIFERYYQGSRSDGLAKKSGEGNGLGLSICKHIIEAHNGSISFKSAKGQGTVFSFTLPLG